jgi:nucleolar GTP-binding protein
VLYDQDHYKLALGQINTARRLCDQIASDYVRMLKYGDTLYRCKQLKRAALGRICTILKKQGPSLGYLEEVRKHLSRLPQINPNTRTLVMCGFPNVGKSSFMNCVTRADVEVQPFAFTTKSLFVGHMDYKYLRWQVIDTPGILDHPLEDRNTIEMQAVTALAHLHASILYFIDISQQCGYTIEQQISLFESIKPLFANKPLFIIANKIDVVKFEDIDSEHREAIIALAKETGAELMTMSSLSEENVTEVKSRACEKLLVTRVEKKLTGKKVNDVLNRLHVSMPENRDGRSREADIPESVLALRAQQAHLKTVYSSGRAAREEREENEKKRREAGFVPRVTQKDIMWQNGGPGIYAQPFFEHYKGMLKNEEWITDIIPSIMDGKNIIDFIDADIDAKLAELEREEAEAEAAGMDEDSESDIDEEERALADEIRAKRKIVVSIARGNKTVRSKVPRHDFGKSTDDVERDLGALGVDTTAMVARGRKRARSVGPSNDDDDEMDVEGGDRSSSAKRTRSKSHDRAKHPEADPEDGEGFSNKRQKLDARKMMKKSQKDMNRHGRLGEADRHATASLIKHLNTGKRGIGKTDRR